MKGIEIKDQNKVNARLENLIKARAIVKYYFKSDEGNGIYRIYCLDKSGKYLLNSREIRTEWVPTNNTKPVHLIKKRLAGNQVIVAYMRKSKNFNSFKVKPQITAKMNGKTFKAHGEVKIAKSGKSLSLLFEAVRREDDWQNKFVERMRLYKDFLENFVPFDSGYEARPQLILVCEDEKHMVETFKEIVTFSNRNP